MCGSAKAWSTVAKDSKISKFYTNIDVDVDVYSYDYLYQVPYISTVIVYPILTPLLYTW